MFSFSKPGKGNKALTWFGFIMSFAYLFLGIFILVDDQYFNDTLPALYRKGLGGLCIGYGLWRAWRFYKDPKERQNYDKE